MTSPIERFIFKYGKEKWFVKVETYGEDRIVVYYRNTKTEKPTLFKIDNVSIKWLKVP